MPPSYGFFLDGGESNVILTKCEQMKPNPNHPPSSLLANTGLNLKTADTLPLLDTTPSDFPIAGGHVHEWFLTGGFSEQGVWHPPLTIMTGLALRRIDRPVEDCRVAWIGRKCWPAFQTIRGLNPAMMSRSVFLDPLTDDERFLAIGQALRCPAIKAVIADGSGMSLTVSRRLQLAAESGTVLGLVARPPWEIDEQTYAATRWEIRPRKTAGKLPSWNIRLVGCRGQQRGQDAPHIRAADWEYQRGTGSLHLSADLGRGIDAPAVEPARSRSA